MALTGVCVRCNTRSEFDEASRGCYRPCPVCDARVLVPYKPAPQAQQVEATCFCGVSEQGPEDGVWYEVQTVRHIGIGGSDGEFDPVAFIVLTALGPIGHLIQALSRRGEAVVERRQAVGWACTQCAVTLERARRWRVWGAVLVCTVFMALPWGAWTWLLARNEMRELDLRWPMLTPLMFLSFFISPLVAYVAYRIGRRVVAWKFSRVHKDYARIGWRMDLTSPVLLHPDGTYASASLGGGPARA